MAKRIYLSPSNQNNNSYATGGTNEMEQCDKIARATATALKRCGFEVKVGKSGDTMANRCRESDNFGADIHMPIHTNAYNRSVTGGTRIFCYSSASENIEPCKAVLKTLGAISPGTADSVSVNSSLYECNTPNAPTIYVEVEFHDTTTGSDWIRNNTVNIGEAITKGLCNYFGYTYKSGGAATSAPSKPTASRPATSAPAKVSMPDAYCCVRAGGHWLPKVKNLTDVAGIRGVPITDVAIKFTEGSCKYRVMVDGRWLPYVTGYDANDDENGYAGNGKPIEAVEVYYNTPERVRQGLGYLRAKYRVSPINGDYYDWQYDNETSNGQDGYAGCPGIKIDRLQLVLSK